MTGYLLNKHDDALNRIDDYHAEREQRMFDEARHGTAPPPVTVPRAEVDRAIIGWQISGGIQDEIQ